MGDLYTSTARTTHRHLGTRCEQYLARQVNRRWTRSLNCMSVLLTSMNGLPSTECSAEASDGRLPFFVEAPAAGTVLAYSGWGGWDESTQQFVWRTSIDGGRPDKKGRYLSPFYLSYLVLKRVLFSLLALTSP